MHVEMDSEDTLALSIHVVTNQDELNVVETPIDFSSVPNGITANSCSEICLSSVKEESTEECLRRSSRFTSNKYKVVSEFLKTDYQFGDLRMSDSPRIHGSAVNCVGGTRKRRGIEVEDEGEGEKKSRLLSWVSGECIGVNADSGVLGLLESGIVQSGNGALGECSLSERSSRLEEVPFDIWEVENGDVDRIDDEKQRSVYDEEIINSRTSDLGKLSGICQLNTEVMMKIDEDIVESSCFDGKDVTLKDYDSPVIITKCNVSRDNAVQEVKVEDKCDSESKVSSEKCLRSRKIIYKVVDVSVNEDSKVLLPKEGSSSKKSKTPESKKMDKVAFIGEPIPEEEAIERWGWRYELKNKRTKRQGLILNEGEEDEVILNVKCHYAQAKFKNHIFSIGDCVFVKGEGRGKHIGRILEFFQTMEGEDHFRVQWFYRAEDTVLKEAASSLEKRRIFYSTVMNDNPLDCILSKVNVVETTPMLGLEQKTNSRADFYYDMEYCVEYSTFRSLSKVKHDDVLLKSTSLCPSEVLSISEQSKQELSLLDLYSGCGGMSTGLCLGAKLAGLNLVTRWAVDADKSACTSLKLNHPETEVINEPAEDFLELLKRWEKLCKTHMCDGVGRTAALRDQLAGDKNGKSVDDDDPPEEYEVDHLIGICFGDPNETGKRDLHFKVSWKGYGPDDDTWEAVKGLSNCEERIRDFVIEGYRSKILPLPGGVDVICGGPPCQGISGYNRYRNVDAPLEDERNRQLVVFMDIVKFLRPKYVLMENVTDILKFSKAYLGRYALSRLVKMKYQARLGTMAAGCYGLPQFRLRVFIWGALPSERLPQFPLPTHEVIVRYWPPVEFERNTVAYDEGQSRKLEKEINLRDAISDLPPVTNFETREEMAYEKPPESEFQKLIRSTKSEMMDFLYAEASKTGVSVLYDHRPYTMSEDNYQRICQVPHRKGANFRDLPGVIVGPDNIARPDPANEAKLPSGEPLIPGCCFTYEQGKSKRPLGRLWWDENVATIVTFPNTRSHTVLHPEQDRVLTIREYARLQGFPDFFRFCGSIKDRYRQVGNAVPVPVARALGYSLGMAMQKLAGDEPVMKLPPTFPLRSGPSNKPVEEKTVTKGSADELVEEKIVRVSADELVEEKTVSGILVDELVEEKTV